MFLLELNPSGTERFKFSWDITDSDNRNVLTLKAKGFKIFIRFCDLSPGKFIQCK